MTREELDELAEHVADGAGMYHANCTQQAAVVARVLQAALPVIDLLRVEHTGNMRPCKECEALTAFDGVVAALEARPS